MIGTRTRYSLAQFLELQEPMMSVVLLSKYGVQHLSLSRDQLLYGLLSTIRGLDERPLMLVLAEVVATKGDLRARVSPKHRFDERLHDLTQCLLLDGYIVEDAKLVQVDPSIADAAPLEDDLIMALQNSGVPRAQEIIAKIGDSAHSSFLSRDPARLQRGTRERPCRTGDASGGRCRRRGFTRASSHVLQPVEIGAKCWRSCVRAMRAPGRACAVEVISAWLLCFNSCSRLMDKRWSSI